MRINFQKLPSKVRFCKTCVISNQRPSSTVETTNNISSKKETIIFDKNGICSACNNHKSSKKINWKKRLVLLEKLLDKNRSKDGSYDVIVPGSGGKDSCYVSYLLKYKFNMNPLTVTWSPHLYTKIGKKNFYSWINKGGHDNLLITPNGSLQRYLTKTAFVNLLHPFQPFIIGQRLIGPKMANNFKIKLIMYGETGAQYGNNVKENQVPTMDSKYFIEKSKNIYLGGTHIKKLISNKKFKKSDFNFYLPLKKSEINQNFEVHHLSYYLPWDPQENFYFANKYCNFQPNIERTEGTYSKYSSIDDKIDNFHYYTTFIKFGLGRASYDAAQEIRNEKITREEGVNLVRKYDAEFPKKYFKDFLEYLSLDKKNFFKIVDSFRSKHLWQKVNKKWILKKPVWKLYS